MNDNVTTQEAVNVDVEQSTTDTGQVLEPGSEVTPEQSDSAEPIDGTVRALRDELAKRRIKAREQVSAANERLALAYVQADGRLIDADAFTISDELLGDDGFIDGDKVTEAIDALLAAKPYLSARKPSTPIAQGVQPLAPETPGLFTLIRERY